jgi:integrating conjugative element protein (TIGR03755 family)
MKKIFLACLCIFPGLASADVRPTGNGSWYYTMGGADPLMYYHQSNKTTFKFGVGAEWNLFQNCSFDPSAAIRENFSDIEENVFGLTNDVIDSATAVFSAWGLSKIREAYPGLYDTLTKGLKDAKETFTVSLKTCRDVQADLKSGRNPADDWFSVTRKSSWAKASADGENPSKAERDIDEKAGDEGVTWTGGEKAGGRNSDGSLQPPIRAINDVTKAGYSHLVGTATALDPDEVTGDPNIARVFPTADSAAEWVTSVVGEREIRTCSGCNRMNTRIGQGLRHQYRKEYEIAKADLEEILEQDEPSNSDLNRLSAPGMGVVVNHHVIRSLKQAPRDERSILAHRLAGEIAIARSLEKALISRDLMEAGSQEPNVTAAGDVAEKEIDKARKRLQSEIDNVMFENDVRQKILTNAAGTISERGYRRDMRSRGEDLYENRINQPAFEMKDGGIKEE